MAKSAPDPPPVPDPIATASAQGEANTSTATAQAALNNANVYGPTGSTINKVTGSQQVVQPDGTVSTVPTYTQINSLSPAQRQLLTKSNALSNQTADIAGSALNNISGTLANPLTASSFAPVQTDAGLSTDYSNGQSVNYNYGSGGQIQNDVNWDRQDTNAPTTFDQTRNQIQGSLGNTDFTTDRDATTNAILARLQPTMDTQSGNLDAQLAAQGLTQGSAAFNAAKFQQNQGNNDLRLGAVSAGDAEQQALFGERLNTGQFANAAQQQEYDQALGRGTFAQTGVGQNNAAVAGNNAAALAAGGFHNTAQAQGETEAAARAAFYNQAQGQTAQENAALAAFGNQAKLAGATFGNQGQQQQYTEGTDINNQLINQINALRTGAQVTPPQFTPYSPSTLDQTPVSADVYASAGLQNQQYTAQTAEVGQENAGLYSLLGNVAGGFFKYSDRRLKAGIRRIGVWTNELPIYAFRYLGSTAEHIGFMADEVALVRPDAVVHDEYGFAAVDYAKAAA